MDKDPHILMQTFKKESDQIAARNYIIDAFLEAMRSGVDADFVIEAALSIAFSELIAVYGEEAVAIYAASLPKRILNGEFFRGLYN